MAAHAALAAFILAAVFPFAGSRRRDRLILWWSARLLRIVGTRLVLEGEPPRTPAVIVANHVAWLDVFVVLSVVPCRFIAKSEIRDWPLAGWIAARSGTIFIRRGRRRDIASINARVHDVLGAGESVGLFPEGTTGEGGALLKFHSSLFEPAVVNAARVHPAAIRYLRPNGTPCEAAIYGERTFLQSLARIIREPAMRAELRFASPLAAGGTHRRELARRAQASVATMLSADNPPERAAGRRVAAR